MTTVLELIDSARLDGVSRSNLIRELDQICNLYSGDYKILEGVDKLLFIAVEYGRILITTFLLKQDTEINAETLIDESKLLHLASRNGHEKIVKLLLDNGANIEATNHDTETALHVAVGKTYKGVVTLLLAYGANTEAKNMRGKTPLHIAVYRYSEKNVELLLVHGASTETKDPKGKTPLHIAVSSFNKKNTSIACQKRS